MNPIEITLGIMTAIGGFVDVTQIVFSAQAGSTFGFALISAFVISTLGMIVFGEMCGRVAAVARQPVFNLMRHRLGLKLGLFTLIVTLISSIITCAAEIGGMGLILENLTGAPYIAMCLASSAVILISIWVLPFKGIERTYGLLGLIMLVFVAALVAMHPPWGKIASGFIPQVPHGLSTKKMLTYCYFVVAIFSAVMLPYQVYFYSSGGIEEEWGRKDVLTNRVTIIIGTAIATLVSIAIIALGAIQFAPANIAPQIPGSVAFQVSIPFGKYGLLLALLGMLIAIAGTAVEVGMTNAYSFAQFFGWEWGRHRKPWEAPRFTIAWIVLFLISVAIVLTGVDVMTLVDYALVFSVVVLPLTYLPVMLLANDRHYLGEYANKCLAKVLGWFFFAVSVAAAVAAVPLYLITSGGQT